MTVDNVEGVFPRNAPEERTSSQESDGQQSSHEHGTRHRDKRRAASAEEAAYKMEKIAGLKTHMFDVLNII